MQFYPYIAFADYVSNLRADCQYLPTVTASDYVHMHCCSIYICACGECQH